MLPTQQNCDIAKILIECGIEQSETDLVKDF